MSNVLALRSGEQMGAVVGDKLVAIDLISDNTKLKFAVAGKMAEAILELKRTQGGCMPQDLNARGFTPAEVAENWDVAFFLIAINGFETWG